MATRKQAEEAYAKIVKAYDRLNEVMRDAENLELLQRAEGEYKENSPFYSLYQLKDRAEKLIEKPMASIIMRDIRKNIRGF